MGIELLYKTDLQIVVFINERSSYDPLSMRTGSEVDKASDQSLPYRITRLVKREPLQTALESRPM